MIMKNEYCLYSRTPLTDMGDDSTGYWIAKIPKEKTEELFRRIHQLISHKT